jgi:NitT/TauT family transport system substrate-binding protein
VREVRLAAIGLCAALLAFAVPPGLAQEETLPPRITIAYQPGIGYAQLLIVKRQRTLERQFPGVSFEWKILTAGAPIRDGMIAGQIQVGAGGVGPFLVGWDRGVGWRILSGLNYMDLWLVVLDPAIRSLRDFKPGMQIGLPAPDSIQAVVLRKGAEKELGNPHALDANMVAVPHPDGLRLLQAGQLKGHLSSPPFQFQEVDMGGRVILRSFDLFGRSTFNSVWMLESFYAKYPVFAKFLYQAIAGATRLIVSNPDAAARILSEEDGGRVSPARYREWITRKGVYYDTIPRGFLKYAEFMKQIGMISKVPASIGQLTLPTIGPRGD